VEASGENSLSWRIRLLGRPKIAAGVVRPDAGSELGDQGGRGSTDEIGVVLAVVGVGRDGVRGPVAWLPG